MQEPSTWDGAWRCGRGWIPELETSGGYTFLKVKVKLLSRLRFCDPTNCSWLGSAVHGDSPGKGTGVGCHFLVQGIFPTQGSNPGPLHCTQTLPSEPPGLFILNLFIYF